MPTAITERQNQPNFNSKIYLAEWDTSIEKQYLAWAELILYNTLLQNKMKESVHELKYNDADIKQRLPSTELAITPLNGEAAGSVKKQIDDAFNDSVAKMSDGSVINTYKELIDYCSTHSAEAAEMEGDIAANKRAISTLETFIGKLPLRNRCIYSY